MLQDFFSTIGQERTVKRFKVLSAKPYLELFIDECWTRQNVQQSKRRLTWLRKQLNRGVSVAAGTAPLNLSQAGCQLSHFAAVYADVKAHHCSSGALTSQRDA